MPKRSNNKKEMTRESFYKYNGWWVMPRKNNKYKIIFLYQTNAEGDQSKVKGNLRKKKPTQPE